MSVLRDQVRETLAAAGLAPLHKLGQNFMVDGAAVNDVVAAALAGSARRVLEIGPGTGILTERLLAADCDVCAIELDKGLAAVVTQRFADLPGCRVVHGDALASKQRLHPEVESFSAQGDWQLVSNLPYDVSIPVILNALALPNPPQRLVVTVQYEAAQRLASQPGSAAWGASAAVCAAAATCRILRRLPPQCFYPRPRVDSALLEVVPLRALPNGFASWCRSVFAYRRKRVSRALRDHGMPREQAHSAVAELGLAEEVRLETLSVDQLIRLHAASLAAASESS